MIKDILFPRRCPVCGEIVRENFVLECDHIPVPKNEKKLICPHCYNKLSFVGDSHCIKCGAPIEDERTEYCKRCRSTRHYFETNRGMLDYTSPHSERLIWDLKYNNKKEYADLIACEMAARYSRYIASSGCEALVPIPIHPSKRRSRGYNQAEVIAARLGAAIRMPVEKDILFRIKKTTPLKELSPAERYANLKLAFAADEYAGSYKKLMVIDDIYTTGSTLDCCALALKSAGVRAVYGLTACIVPGRE